MGYRAERRRGSKRRPRLGYETGQVSAPSCVHGSSASHCVRSSSGGFEGDDGGDGNGDGDGDGDGGEAGTGKTTLAPVEDTCTWVGSETSRHSVYISCSPSCLVQ